MDTTLQAQRPGTLPSTDVARLVRRAADGDATAWDELVDAFGGVVWAVTRSYRLSDADAADVFQTTWLYLLEDIDRIREPGHLAGWLATTARRTALRVARQNARTVPTEDERAFAAVTGDDATASLEAEEQAAAMRKAFATLARRDRVLLSLLVADPRPSYDEIADALEMPVGSIGPTRARSLGRLRRAAVRAGVRAVA